MTDPTAGQNSPDDEPDGAHPNQPAGTPLTERDMTDTDHRTGEAQAAQNEATESPT